MSKASRNKGQSGEREVCAILNEALGTSLNRTLDQVRDGGCDIIVGNYAIEVKRCENLSIKAWWLQAVSQGQRLNKTPVLVYRQSRNTWKTVTPLADDKDPLNFYIHADMDYLIDLIEVDKYNEAQLVRKGFGNGDS